jgi:uncharacterized protein
VTDIPQDRAVPSSPPVRAVVAFLGVVLSLMTGSWLIVGTAVAPLLPGGWITLMAGALLLSFAPLAVFLGVRGLRIYAPGWMRILVFRLMLIGCAIAAMLGALTGLPLGAARLVAQWSVLAALVADAFVIVAGYVGSLKLMRRDIDAIHPDVPEALDGVTIIQLSDLHVGPHTRKGFLRAIERCVQSVDAELVVITGDVVDDFADDVDYLEQLLPSLRHPERSEGSASRPILVVPGNHDVYAGWPETRARLERAGMTVLVNTSTTIELRGEPVTLIGTGDPAGGPRGDSRIGAPNIRLALSGVPKNQFAIALAHNPALWPALASAGIPLTLSGHTHWGQLAIPSRGWCFASVFLEYAMGWHRIGDSVLWISPGTGYWGVPFRIGAPGEVTVVTLRRGSEAGIRETRHSDVGIT